MDLRVSLRLLSLAGFILGLWLGALWGLTSELVVSSLLIFFGFRRILLVFLASLPQTANTAVYNLQATGPTALQSEGSLVITRNTRYRVYCLLFTSTL